MNNVRLPLVLVALVVLGAFLAGCGSSSKSSDPSPAAGGGGSCPFSGSTAQQSEPGVASSTTLGSITPSLNGCIDQLAFSFAPTLATSTAAYTPGQPQLVVTLTNTSYSGPTTLSPGNLKYVKAISVSSKSGEVDVALTLDQQRQFLMSSSKVPAAMQLAIG